MFGSASPGNAGVADQPKVTALEEAILGQPEAISDAITTNLDQLRAAMAIVAGARRVRLTGIGFSYYAALAGEWMFRDIGVKALVSNAYDLSQFTTGFEPGDVLIGVSNSGDDDTVASLQRAAQSGLKTIAIVSQGVPVPDVDVKIETGPGDKSATVTLGATAAMAVLAAIAARFEPRSQLATAVPTLPDSIRAMLPSRDTARQVSAALTQDRAKLVVVGGGGLTVSARYAAAAISQASRTEVGSLHLSDVTLGGLAPYGKGDVLVQLLPSGAPRPPQERLAEAAEKIGLRRWQIGGPGSPAEWRDQVPNVPDAIIPILAVVPLQWLALELSILLGIDPDALRHPDAFAQDEEV